MEIEVLKSKIHRAVITEANLNYVGSLTLDEDLMDAANMIENEKVQIVNVNNGSRIETYIIKGKRGSGVCCLNGPAARRGSVGDIVIVISYANMDFEEAKKLLVDEQFEVDYFEIADAGNLSPVNDWDGQTKVVAITAAFIDGVRLIDNMIVN